MDIIHRRLYDNHRSTSGEFVIEGVVYCATLEDEHRLHKVAKETRIPAGRYPIKIRKEGSMYPRYLKKYGTDGMIHIQNVPNFTWVYIHVGDGEEDTDGCIIIGRNLIRTYNDFTTIQTIGASSALYKEFHALVYRKIKLGEKIFINIFDT